MPVGVAIGNLGLWLVSCILGLNRRERHYSFSIVAIDASSLLNVVPGMAGRMPVGVAIGNLGLWLVSGILGINRRERWQYSFSNVA
jgi:RNase H-fold protein (predicted Holliday junction resolvase)